MGRVVSPKPTPLSSGRVVPALVASYDMHSFPNTLPCIITDAFKKAKDTFGRLDIVVNNAGTVSELDPSWEGSVLINLVSMSQFLAQGQFVWLGYLLDAYCVVLFTPVLLGHYVFNVHRG